MNDEIEEKIRGVLKEFEQNELDSTALDMAVACYKQWVVDIHPTKDCIGAAIRTYLAAIKNKDYNNG